MNNINELWGKRLKEYWNMAIGYLRLIGNSGFLFTIYLAIIVGSYYYGELLRWLPEKFPASLFLAVITAVMLTKSSLRTFLKEGDVVFLSPIETKLSSYFKFSYIYSLIIQCFVILFVVVIMTPMYRYMIDESVQSLLFVVAILWVGKGWNLLVQWEEQRLLYDNHRLQHLIMRFSINFSLTYLLFLQASIYFILGILVIKLLLFLLYYQHFKKQYSLKWEHLVEVEEKMLMTFYRIANTFTDVPKLNTKVKKRRIISQVINLFPFSQSATYHYMYTTSFIRANDYYGIYIRLLFIGMGFIYFIPLSYGRLFVCVLLIYMSALQLSTLKNHHSLKVWPDIYPISTNQKDKSLSDIVWYLLIIKAVIFTTVNLIVSKDVLESAIMLIVSIAVSYTYSYFLIHRKKGKIKY